MVPQSKELATGLDGKPLKAIMPADAKDSGSDIMLNSQAIESSELFDDFAIDITHIEKYVQDSDSIICEQK